VGFRAFLREEARAAGLSGWVRNCRDGTVEAVLGGSAEGLAQVRAAAAAGPPGARVDAVEASEPPPGTAVSPGVAVLPTE
jgi:acylphosphatase